MATIQKNSRIEIDDDQLDIVRDYVKHCGTNVGADKVPNTFSVRVFTQEVVNDGWDTHETGDEEEETSEATVEWATPVPFNELKGRDPFAIASVTDEDTGKTYYLLVIVKMVTVPNPNELQLEYRKRLLPTNGKSAKQLAATAEVFTD